MIDEPYRWLEAIANRREYVRDQIKGGSPVLACSLEEGLLLLGVGSGQSKVFEIFDRHALTGLGHPADIERIRQAAIDSAHMEAFTRAAEDVSLRRLVSFGLGPQLKTNFEQIVSAPFLIELILTELGAHPKEDLLVRLHFDGTFELQHGGLMIATSDPDLEKSAREWLKTQITPGTSRNKAAELMLQAWWVLGHGKSFASDLPPEWERQQGWKNDVENRTVEVGWLNRRSNRRARYEALSRQDLGL